MDDIFFNNYQRKEGGMKHFSAVFCTLSILLTLGLAKDIELPKNEQTSIIYNSQEYNLNNIPAHQEPNQTREQINLFFEDFEGDHEWSGDGWNATDANAYSGSYSEHTADDATTANGNWNLLSPTISLPALGDGETMHFDFFLDNNMPDYQQEDDPSTPDVNESDYLADYLSLIHI